MKSAWKILIGLGVFLVLLSFGMDTTVSSGIGRVHNMGLQQDRQNMLILGCFMFMAGIVLYAVKKVKQTPEELAAEEKAQQTSIEATNGRVEDWSAKADEIGKVLSKVRAGTDNIPGRTCAGLAIGLLWGIYGAEVTFSPGIGFTLFFAAFLYSQWPQPWRTVLIRLALANLAFLVLIFAAVYVTRDWSMTDMLSRAYVVKGVLMMFILPFILSVALFLFLRRKARPQ